MLPYLKGEVDESLRSEFLYWADNGNIAALRHSAWQVDLHGAASAWFRRLARSL